MNRMIRKTLFAAGLCLLASCQTQMSSEKDGYLRTYRRPIEMAEPFDSTFISEASRPAMPVSEAAQGVRPQTSVQRPLPPPQPPRAVEQHQDASQILEKAQVDATQHPDDQAFINAVQVYHFEPGAVYEIITAPGFVTILRLRPGEEVKHVAAGDTSRWLIDVIGAGNVDSFATAIRPIDVPADAGRVCILIKPRFPLLQTNVVIATNEREYMIDLKSFEKTYHSAVEWTYPQRPIVFASQSGLRHSNAARETGRRNYIYSLQAPPGGLPAWAPEAVYDDGHRVFVEFAPSINDFRRPPLYLLDDDGVARMVNYRTEANHYVVEELFDRAALRIGNERVVIQRTLSRPTTASARRN